MASLEREVVAVETEADERDRSGSEYEVFIELVDLHVALLDGEAEGEKLAQGIVDAFETT